MTKTNPWHSLRQNVHHDNTRCADGRNIHPSEKREGTGGKPLCQQCARLKAESKG